MGTVAAQAPRSSTEVPKPAQRAAPASIWSTADFSVGLDEHGLVTSLVNPADPLKMDRVRKEGPAWGLPMTREQGKLVTWEAPILATSSDRAEELRFVDGPFRLVLQQSPDYGRHAGATLHANKHFQCADLDTRGRLRDTRTVA